MTTIHGLVHSTISVANALMLDTMSSTKLPMKMNATLSVPISSVAWTRDSLRKIELKSRPVPYSDVVPVDNPPINATTIRGIAYHSGEIAVRPVM